MAAAPSQSLSPIPTFYRIFFNIVNPLMTLGGTITYILSPATILSGWVPGITTPIAPEVSVLMYGLSGWHGGMALLSSVLLRLRPNDLVVWNSIQGALVILDIFMLAGIIKVLVEGGWKWRGGDHDNVSLGFARLEVELLAGAGKRWTKGKDCMNERKLTVYKLYPYYPVISTSASQVLLSEAESNAKPKVLALGFYQNFWFLNVDT